LRAIFINTAKLIEVVRDRVYAFTESWNFDKTGNWTTYDKNAVVENRTHSAANEILTISGLTSQSVHDKNGNMTILPDLKGKYDAWNRLVEVRDSSGNLIARYDYNGLNQRIRKTVGNVVTTSFFNERWQELESREPGTMSPVTTFVWGLRYIDDLVLRERGSEKLYSLADPNWNVVATTNAAGVVQERMRYGAFGKVTWLGAYFVAKQNTDYNWNRTFTEQVLDNETGLMLYRNRYYHTELGRFVTRDPIGYFLDKKNGIEDSDDEFFIDIEDLNVYRYVGNRSTLTGDPLGLWTREDCDRWYEYCGDGCRSMPGKTWRQRNAKRLCWVACFGEYSVCLAASEEAIKCYIVGAACVLTVKLVIACPPLGGACAATLVTVVVCTEGDQ
jgi:RHS repeat-associated protein